MEEAGIVVELTGILSIEYVPHDGYTRLRCIFVGKPVSVSTGAGVHDGGLLMDQDSTLLWCQNNMHL